MFRKAVRERTIAQPPISMARLEPEDRGREGLPALPRSSRFRAHDEGDDEGHVYSTARYPTRFD